MNPGSIKGVTQTLVTFSDNSLLWKDHTKRLNGK